MQATSTKTWLNIALFNLCVVAALGLIMRSKMIFDLPWVNYNRLVEAHGNFAFVGWVTLALLTLMLSELPVQKSGSPIYKWVLTGIVVCSWANLIVSPSEKWHGASEYISTFSILLTYVFTWRFIKDLRKGNGDKIVKLLAICALLFLVISSVGTFMLGYLFATKSLNAVLYRDALFGYLHLQYNGFFTLAVFSIAFNKIDKVISEKARKTVYRFSLLLCSTVIPSMFITFQWHDTNIVSHTLSQIGSVLLFATLVWLGFTAKALVAVFKSLARPVRIILVFSINAFGIKLLLQCLTIFQPINVQVFGNRPAIMGFLHLVFLGFVTLFLIAYFAQTGVLNIGKIFTRVAMFTLAISVIANEILLGLQGLGNIFTIPIISFNWILWVVGILLLLGSTLVFIARKITG